MSNQEVLLDTHVWIWLVNGDSTLSTLAKKAIAAAAQNEALFISVFSVWEVAMLQAKNKITLSKSCLEWVRTALVQAGIQLMDFSPEVAVESCHLPGDFHGDPADRIIMATAKLEALTLITRDQKILEYSKKKHIATIKA